MAILPIPGEPSSRVKFCKGKRSAVYWRRSGNPCEMRGKTPMNIMLICPLSDTIIGEGPDFHQLQQSFTLLEESLIKSKAIHPPNLG